MIFLVEIKVLWRINLTARIRGFSCKTAPNEIWTFNKCNGCF